MMSSKVLYFTKGAYVSMYKALVPFENDMMDMIKKLEFKRVNNEFQLNLRNDIRQIQPIHIGRQI